MSFEAAVANSQQYTDNVRHLLQQNGSKLRKAVMEGSYTGKAAKAVEQIGAVEAEDRTTRHDDTPLISTPHDARWVYPIDSRWADLIDDEDKLRQLAKMDSPYAENGARALGRKIDQRIIEAFFGDARTGENGTDVTSFPGDNSQTVLANVGAGGDTGLNIAKLRSAKKILMANEVDIDSDPLYVAITAEQHDDLLNETQAISLDFNTKPVLVDGRISSFMGFEFIHSEKLALSGSNRRCPCWAKSGMHLGVWNDVTTRITERSDKNHATQVFVTGTFGATRTEEKKVVEILCAES